MKGCRPLQKSEVNRVSQAFCGTFANRDRALFILGTGTGFRVSELLSLRVKDVWQHRHIADSVTVQKQHRKGKTSSLTQKLNAQVKRNLHAWIQALSHLESFSPDMYLFQSRKGENKAISRVRAWQVLHTVFEKCKLTGKLATHSMRKTFADMMYKALHGDLVRLQAALGHVNINSTVSYLSFSKTDIDDAIATLF